MITYKLENQLIHKEKTGLNWIERFSAFADKQEKWALGWWAISLILIGGFLVPLTFLAVYTIGGPVLPFLAISMLSFFAVFISNMCGMGMRTNIFLFFFSIALHIFMVLFSLLLY